MVKKATTTTTTTTTEPAVVPQKVEGKKGEGKKAEGKKDEGKKADVKKSKAEVAATTGTATETATDADASVSVATGTKTGSMLIDIQAQFQNIQSFMNTLKGDIKTLSRVSAKEMKILEKSTGRNRKKSAGTRQPSGFVKPTPISDELAKFLNKEKGIEMARTDVTREINAYIRAHSLQDKANGRQINADSKLSNLLKLDKTDVLTYFNLQRYMSKHFPKTPSSASASATNTVVAN